MCDVCLRHTKLSHEDVVCSVQRFGSVGVMDIGFCCVIVIIYKSLLVNLGPLQLFSVQVSIP